MARRDAAFRLAMWKAWNERCAWCHNALDFGDMEVEHLIPKSLKGEMRWEVLKAHGLAEDYDLDSTQNLGPAHGHPCNRAKASSPLPDSPRIALLLAKAEHLAPEIESAAASTSQGEEPRGGCCNRRCGRPGRPHAGTAP